MNFSRTSGFGFNQSKPKDDPSSSKDNNNSQVQNIDPRELTEKRKQVLFRTTRHCSALFKTAKQRSIPELQKNLLPQITSPDFSSTSLSASQRHQTLRRAILHSWFVFSKCNIRIESIEGCSLLISGLDQLFKALLLELQKQPFESFFVLPFLKDMQQQQKQKDKLPSVLASFQKRVILRLHGLCVACVSQSIRASKSTQLSFVEHAATLLHLISLIGNNSAIIVESTTSGDDDRASSSSSSSSMIKCMTIPPNLNANVSGAMTKIVNLASSSLGESLTRDLLQYPLERIDLVDLNNNSNNSDDENNSNNSVMMMRKSKKRHLFTIADLLDSLWSRGDTSALLSVSAVSRTHLLKYLILLCVQYLNTNNNSNINSSSPASATTSPLQKVRKFLLWAVLRLPWHSVDKKPRSVFADWQPAIQNVIFDVCTQIFTSSMLTPSSNAFSVTFEKIFAARSATFHKWLPDVPVAAFASMTNCVCNIFFFSTSCMLMNNSNSGKWQSLLGEMCLALHPFKTYPAQQQQQQQSSSSSSSSRAPSLSSSNMNAFDGIFEVLDGSSSSKISSSVASPTITAHWFNSVSRLWNEEILKKIFGVARTTTTTTSSVVAPSPTTQDAAPKGKDSTSDKKKENKESFGDTIRRALSDALGERGSGGIRPVWFPDDNIASTIRKSFSSASDLQNVSKVLPELNLPPSHLSWFGFSSFLNAIVSRGKIVSILNTFIRLHFFIPMLWRRVGDMNGGRRWIERAIFYVSSEGRAAIASALNTNSTNNKNMTFRNQVVNHMIKEMEIACDYVSCTSLFFGTLSHAFLVGSDDDIKNGWPLPFAELDSITGFANTLHLVIVALNDSGSPSKGTIPPLKQVSSLQDQLMQCKTNLRRFLRLLEDRDVRMNLVPEKRRQECFWGVDKESLKWANSLTGPTTETPSSRGRDYDRITSTPNGPLTSTWIKALATSSGDAQTEPSLIQKLSNVQTFAENASVFSMAICREMPHAVPFDLRVAALRAIFQQLKAGRLHGRFNNIRRDHVVLDGFRLFVAQIGYNEPKEHLRSYMQIQLLDEHGRAEAGIDGGGVFKEFLELLLKEITNPQLGLFALTADNSQCYPNPGVQAVWGNGESFIQGVQATDMFRFLGRVLGKAIFEGIVVTLPLAGFFLNNVIGRPNVLEDLIFLDPQLYRSLSQLKEMEDVSLAGLYFADEQDFCGTVKTIPLIPGGEDIEVTNDNVVRYLHALAHYRLVKSIQPLTDAFVAGLSDIIDKKYISMFNAKELRQLISGKDGGDFDVNELMEHTQYAMGYTSVSSQVRWLWDVLKEDCSKEDRAAFLQFCTGSSRPPLLGFASMEPKFAIQLWKPTDEQRRQQQEQRERGFFDRVFGNDDVQFLPMAATCFNLLKLPEYTSKANLRDRVLTAIRSKAGFEYA